MQNIIFTANNEGVVSKNAIFQKFGVKCLKIYFLKLSLDFLLEDAKSFHLKRKLPFYYQKCFSIATC